MDAAAGRPLSCAEHPERPAHARCMSCRKVLCQECATEWDGINYCSRCLQARGAAAGKGSGALAGAVLILLIGGLLVLHTRVLAWMGVVVASLL
jgi:hypothetical protein